MHGPVRIRTYRLGHTKEELIAQNVVCKLERVMETAKGEEIAVRSASDIVSRLRKENCSKIADELELQLIRKHPSIKWDFPGKA